MAIGKGKYDDQVLRLIHKYNADAAVVLVVGGRKGPGASMKLAMPDSNPVAAAELMRLVARALREIAANIDEELACALRGEIKPDVNRDN